MSRDLKKGTKIETYLNSSIKEIIKEFPQVERILGEYGIECGSCAMGLCLLKDILEIHKLLPDENKKLMDRIFHIMATGKESISEQEKGTSFLVQEINYSPPMKKLVEEHAWIKRWLALIPEVITYLTLKPKEKNNLLLAGVDFIRSYADNFHHAKEEDILFKYFKEDLDILKVMQEEHNIARNIVQRILNSLDRKDENGLVDNLKAYEQLLIQHIKKEDEVLFPWLERQLSPDQISELVSKFQKKEGEIDFDPLYYEKFIEELEGKIKTNKYIRHINFDNS